MATIQPDGSAVTSTSTVNDGGTMIANGSAVGLNTLSPNREKVSVFGSTPVNNSDATKALSTGEFAHNHQTPISKRMTSELSGVSSDALATTGGTPDLIRSIHKLETLRTRRQTLAIRNNKWDQYTGAFDPGYPVVAVDTLDTDVAANPSRSVPGKLNFMTGSPLPNSVNYKSRTN